MDPNPSKLNWKALVPIFLLVISLPFIANSVQKRQLLEPRAGAPATPNTYPCSISYPCPSPTPPPPPYNTPTSVPGIQLTGQLACRSASPDLVNLIWTSYPGTYRYYVTSCTGLNCANFTSVTSSATFAWQGTINRGENKAYRIMAEVGQVNQPMMIIYSNIVRLTNNCPVPIQLTPTPNPTPRIVACGEFCGPGSICQAGFSCQIGPQAAGPRCLPNSCATGGNCSCNVPIPVTPPPPSTNHAPQFVKFPFVSLAYLGRTWRITISATDVDIRDTLNMFSTGFPTWVVAGPCAHSSGSVACTFQGQVTSTGLYYPNITVFDGRGGSASRTFTLFANSILP